MDRQEQMYSLVEQYHKSGLSIKSFSKEHGISHYTLSYWISKKRKAENLPGVHSRFIPIAAAPSFNTSTGTLEITYPNGVKIRLSSMDMATIGSLIRLG